MSPPPLYKFLDVRGAKLTLGNQTFKHAKPSDFNDSEDLTVQSIFPEPTEIALQKITDNFQDVLLQNIDKTPVIGDPIARYKLAMIQAVYRSSPEAAEVIKAEMQKEKEPIYDIEYMRVRATKHLNEINEFLQRFRVLCVTTHITSKKMWCAYAEHHKGIALRIQPNVEKDSIFQCFQPVTYYEKRPSFYDDTLDFVSGALFGDMDVRTRAVLEKILHAKTLRWQHEGEYRLVIPLQPGEQSWNTRRYYPEEVTELYLGKSITDTDRKELARLARIVNPDIAIFQMAQDSKSELMSNPI